MKNPALAADLPDLLAGWVFAEGVSVADSDRELAAELDDVTREPARQGLNDHVRAGVRDLLRGHGYKPSGRGKPASEFLAGAAARGEFPRINNVVDINNLVSLETGWPISVIDSDRAGDELELRHGRENERFAFNTAGHEIDVAGLLCVARVGGDAIANPVKDSMATKLTAGTRRVLAVLYTSRKVATPDDVSAATRRFGDLLVRHAGATRIESGILGS